MLYYVFVIKKRIKVKIKQTVIMLVLTVCYLTTAQVLWYQQHETLVKCIELYLLMFKSNKHTQKKYINKSLCLFFFFIYLFVCLFIFVCCLLSKYVIADVYCVVCFYFFFSFCYIFFGLFLMIWTHTIASVKPKQTHNV